MAWKMKRRRTAPCGSLIQSDQIFSNGVEPHLFRAGIRARQSFIRWPRIFSRMFTVEPYYAGSLKKLL